MDFSKPILIRKRLFTYVTNFFHKMKMRKKNINKI